MDRERTLNLTTGGRHGPRTDCEPDAGRAASARPVSEPHAGEGGMGATGRPPSGYARLGILPSRALPEARSAIPGSREPRTPRAAACRSRPCRPGVVCTAIHGRGGDVSGAGNGRLGRLETVFWG